MPGFKNKTDAQIRKEVGPRGISADLTLRQLSGRYGKTVARMRKIFNYPGWALDRVRSRATVWDSWAPPAKPKKVGSLRRIAARDRDGLKADGKISKTWARRKLKAPGTHKSTRAKLRFFLNMN